MLAQYASLEVNKQESRYVGNRVDQLLAMKAAYPIEKSNDVILLAQASPEAPKVESKEAADDKKADDKKADAAQPDSKPRPPKAAKPVRLTIKQRRELEALETEQEALRGKLIQTRLTAAATLFEKAKAYPEKSKERTDTLTASAKAYINALNNLLARKEKSAPASIASGF